MKLWWPEPWDSDQFDIPMGRLQLSDLHEIDTALHEAATHGIRYLFTRVPAARLDLQHALEDRGFCTLGTLLTLAHKPSTEAGSDMHAIRYAVPGDIQPLQAIAATAFQTSRFHADPDLDKRRADALWARSVAEAVQGRADRVLVADVDGAAAGFLTLRRHTAGYSIDLVAVGERFQRRGVGRQLMRAACRYAAERDATLEVGTQSHNFGALHLYQRHGFRIVSATVSYRKWL